MHTDVVFMYATCVSSLMFVDTLNGQLFFFVNDTPIRIPADQVGEACFLLISRMVLQCHA